MNPGDQNKRPANKLVALALISFSTAALFGPYFLLDFQSALIVSLVTCVLLATGCGLLCRSMGLKTAFTFGTYIFVGSSLASASIGVFFIFTFGKALLAFLAISVAGAIILTALGILVATQISPNLSGSSGDDGDAGKSITSG